MTGLKLLVRLVGAYFSILVGMVAWLAQWVDAQDTPWGFRGLVVLGMTAWVFITLVFAALEVDAPKPKVTDFKHCPCDGCC